MINEITGDNITIAAKMIHQFNPSSSCIPPAKSKNLRDTAPKTVTVTIYALVDNVRTFKRLPFVLENFCSSSEDSLRIPAKSSAVTPASGKYNIHNFATEKSGDLFIL